METVQLESPRETAAIKAPAPKPEIGERLGSLDAFRGTIMLLMLNEATRLPLVARSFPHSAIWAFIAFNTEHVDWQGCSLQFQRGSPVAHVLHVRLGYFHCGEMATMWHVRPIFQIVAPLH